MARRPASSDKRTTFQPISSSTPFQRNARRLTTSQSRFLEEHPSPQERDVNRSPQRRRPENTEASRSQSRRKSKPLKRPGVKLLREIAALQKSDRPMIPLLPFCRVVRDVANEISPESVMTRGETDPLVVEDNDASLRGGNPAWADAMQKILSVEVKKQDPILSKKPKKHHQLKEEDSLNVDAKSKDDEDKTKLSKNRWNDMNRVKPSPLDRDRERRYVKIATKGVVQLFNAVEQHQKRTRKEVNSSLLESRRDKKLAECGQGMFMEMLNRQKVKKEEISSEDETSPKKWKVLSGERKSSVRLKDWNSDDDDDSN
ncbi:unnamed protein product [Notodromas monacha]|uniref:RRP15-like protein n=1 Tax=Notodromas monacha TaxID=399045 RepID=A0A7R9BG77_9CRUS|nr:unnamed protein product [Notodromas monacha]CAG0913577.1 unnamed protein product [Notodromas monacha]